MNLIGRAVQGKWQYDIRTNLIGRACGNMITKQMQYNFSGQHFSLAAHSPGGG